MLLNRWKFRIHPGIVVDPLEVVHPIHLTIIPHWENHGLLRIATMVEAMEDHQLSHMEEVKEAEEDPHRMVMMVMGMVGLKDPMNRAVQLYSRTTGMRVKEAAVLK